MASEFSSNLNRDSQEALNKIAQVDQELQQLISSLENRTVKKDRNQPAHAKKRGKKSSRRH
jgi:hypothetical protein